MSEPAPVTAIVEPGTVISGKYRIDRILSTGGMGSVFVARHLQLGMPVAVKLMSPALADTAEGRSRFEREARAAALIQSQHVIKVHDYGVEATGTPFLVMELLQGEDLGARLVRERRLSLPATARIVAQVARGLRRASDAGVVHRDLKPANIFLTRSDDEEIVKILDFGIAKLLRPEGEVATTTATGVVLGSFHYMSPEQARAQKGVDHRTDLWSLGVIAYRALTGEHPFRGTSPGDLIVKICVEPIPHASAALPDLDAQVGRDLDRFFARALARNPADRFQTSGDLAAALAAIAGLDPALLGTTAPAAATPMASPMDADTDAGATLREPHAPAGPAPRAAPAAATGGEREAPPDAPAGRPGRLRRATLVLGGGVAVAAVVATAAILGRDPHRPHDVAAAPATATMTPAETGRERDAPKPEAQATTSASALSPPTTADGVRAPSGRRHPAGATDRVKRDLGF